MHLAQLDKRARKFDWGQVLDPAVPMRVEATSRKSRIYHAGAARQRVERALSESFGATVSDKAALRVIVRLEDDLCTISIDTSGDALHKRGYKAAVGKAPMRETLAALFLRECGFDGNEPVLDPMCGSGTFVLEAAEMAAGLKPGRARHFAFEHLRSFDDAQWQEMRAGPAGAPSEQPAFMGFDRNAGAIEMSRANAERAGLGASVVFAQQAISDLQRPDGPPGLVIMNPPYGARIGNKKLLYGLYGSIGKTMQERFSGWRVGIVTSETGLARATGLPFLPGKAPVAHGGLKIRLFQTEPLS
jgi:putative N6-adenine-specific DNA methylase